ncbi:MAG: hypothetical protein ACFFD3_16075 [Candidatus Thorarchaeota archaeon]
MARGPEHFARDWLEMGIRMLKQQKYEKAEECFRKALGFKDDIADVWWHLGLTLKSLLRGDEADEAFRKAAELDPLRNERNRLKNGKTDYILDNEVFKETGKQMRIREFNVKKAGEYLLHLIGESFGDSNDCNLAIFVNGEKKAAQKVLRKIDLRVPLGLLKLGAHRLGIILETTTGHWEIDASLEDFHESHEGMKFSPEDRDSLAGRTIPFTLNDNQRLQLQADAKALLLAEEVEGMNKKSKLILKARIDKGQEDYERSRRKHPLMTESEEDWMHHALFRYVYYNEDVEPYLLNVLSLNPLNSRARYMLAASYLFNGKHKEIIALLESHLSVSTEDVLGWAILSVSFATKRSHTKSKKSIDCAIEFAPKDGTILLASALRNYLAKKDDEASEYLRKVIHLKLDWPDFSQDSGKFIFMHYVIKRIQEIVKKRILDGTASSLEVSTRDSIFNLLKREDEEELVSDVMSGEPVEDLHNAETWYDYGCACALRNDLVNAEAALKRAIELRSDWGEAWGNYGKILMRSSKYKEGLEALRYAKKLGWIDE